MNWTAIYVIAGHFALISGGGFAATKLLPRFNLGDGRRVEDAAMFLAANAVIGEFITYFCSFGGNNMFYALLSLACLSSCLVPLALGLHYEARMSRATPTFATRICGSLTVMICASTCLLEGGIWAGVMNSGSVHIAATSVAVCILILSATWLLLMSLMPSGATS
jgi:hypothetical protein